MSSETARGLSASIQQATENIARKAEEAQDVDTPLGARLSSNWKSVVEATKHAVDETRKVVEKEQSRLFDNKKPVKRDLKLPLDVEALRDAEVVYITERIITMGHPALQSQVDESITPNRKLAAVAHLLERRHGGRYMVWNLSEVEYDVDMLDDQVLTFSFPGSPSPPLGLLLKLLMSMESWLKADERNVAVVHCLTGKGRTSTVLAAFLCWIGEAGFSNVQDALEYIAQCKKLTAEQLTIPSQRRYVKYFANMLDGVRPSQPPIVLKRVIMSEAPKVSWISAYCYKCRICCLLRSIAANNQCSNIDGLVTHTTISLLTFTTIDDSSQKDHRYEIRKLHWTKILSWVVLRTFNCSKLANYSLQQLQLSVINKMNKSYPFATLHKDQFLLTLNKSCKEMYLFDAVT